MPRLQASTGQAREAENLPSQTGQPPVRARGLRSRAALVRAARAVFERDGFLEARIVDICAEAGIATGSFYTYFKTKEDAFAAVMARLQARGLADPTLDPFGTAHAMNAMVSRMASLVFVYGFDMSFDALAELLLQLWTNALRIPTDSRRAAGRRQP
jgi:AcrR family transcriptional regulator